MSDRQSTTAPIPPHALSLKPRDAVGDTPRPPRQDYRELALESYAEAQADLTAHLEELRAELDAATAEARTWRAIAIEAVHALYTATSTRPRVTRTPSAIDDGVVAS